MKKRVLGLFAAIAVFTGVITIPVYAGETVEYLDAAETTQQADCTELTEEYLATNGNELFEGWYVVKGEVTCEERILIDKGENGGVDVHLILADGAHLNAKKGISVPGSKLENNKIVELKNSLTIYSQSLGADMGALTANSEAMNAGIGGNKDTDGGIITINGGTINAAGSTEKVTGADSGSAGIGGGYHGHGGTIIVNNGNVTAKAGYGAAGIGHGMAGGGGIATITGGTVTASGSFWGQGIGANDVKITGGLVYANGGEGDYWTAANSIGDGRITISGENTVVITNSNIHDGGETNGVKDVQFNGGLIIEGNSGATYGNVTLTQSIEVPSSATVTIEENETLTINSDVTLTNNGEITGSGKILNYGTITGTVDSGVKVITPPEFTEQPEAKKVTAKESVSFSVVEKGTLGTKLQWQVSTDGGATWTNIEGATSKDYRINPVAFSMNGNQYRCAAKNEAGEVKSNAAVLTVNQIPLAEPANVEWDASVVNKATWSAVENASGYSVQLYKNGQKSGEPVTVSGKTEHPFTISEDGKYTYGVTALGDEDYKSSEEVKSKEVTFIAAGITKNPENQTVTVGEEAIFVVEVKGTPEPERQWQVSTDGGTTWTDIEGEKASIYKIKAVDYGMNGWQYRYKVKNFMGETFSNASVLTVNKIQLAGPTNLKWDREVFGKVTWDAVEHASGYSVCLYKNGDYASEPVTVSEGTEYQFIISEEGDYAFTVTALGTGNYCDSNAEASRSRLVTEASIDSQPDDQTVTAGKPAEFEVWVSGGSILGYQWQVSTDNGTNWTDIQGATEEKYTIDESHFNMNGWKYRCAVKDYKGLKYSDAAVLTVNQIPLSEPTGLKWDDEVVNKITWNAVEHASGYSIQLYSEGEKAGEAITVWGTTECLAAFTKDGVYSFTVTAIGTEDYSNGTAVSSLTSGVKDGVRKFISVSFDSQGGSTVDAEYTVVGGKVAAPEEPEKKGYTFKGWYTSSDFSEGTEWNFEEDTVTKSITLYAKWEKNVEIPKDNMTPKTGDGINIGFWMAAMILSFGSVLTISFQRRKYR